MNLQIFIPLHLITSVLSDLNSIKSFSPNNLKSCINNIQDDYISRDFLIYINLNDKYSDLQLEQPVIIQNKMQDLKYFQIFKATYYLVIVSEEKLQDVFFFLAFSYSWNPRAKFLVVLDKPYEDLFRIVRKYHVFNILMLTSDNDGVQITTYFPFKSVGSTKIDTCTNGSLQNKTSLFSDKLPVNWKNTTVRAIYLIYPPYVLKTPKIFAGMEVENIELLQRVVGFNIVYENKSFKNWGRRLKNGSYAGAYSYIRNYEVDLAYGFFYANRNEHWDFDQTYPYMEDNAKWVVPMAKIEENWKGVLKIFNIFIWVLIFITFFCCTFLLVLSTSKSILRKRITHYFIVSYKCFLGQAVDLPSKTFLRTVLGIWILFGLIFTSAFQGKLISVLNVKGREKQITNVKELIKSKMKFGFYNDSRYLFINSDNKYDQYIYDNYEMCPLDFQCLNRTAFRGDFATFKPKKLVEFMISRSYLDNQGHSLVYMFKSNIYNVLVTMTFAKGYPLFDKINKLLSEMRSAGFIDLRYKTSLYYAEKAIKAAKKKSFVSNTLTINDLLWIFWILVFGAAIGLLVLTGEILVKKCLKKNQNT